MPEKDITTQTNNECFFLKKLWKGEYSLFVSFWGFGFLVLFCLGFFFAAIPQKGLSEWLILNFGPIGGFIPFLIFCFCFYLYVVILYVGVWRSANNYTGRSIWKVVTKILVCFWWICLLGQSYFLVKNIAPVISNLYEICEIQNIDKDIELANKFIEQNRNFNNAIKLLEKATKYNNKQAQCLLGIVYCYGLENNSEKVSIDLSKAKDLFELSANQNYAPAQYQLGKMYFLGNYVEQDYEKAINLWKKSANNHYNQAANMLGNVYYHGIGVEQDYQVARNYLGMFHHSLNDNAYTFYLLGMIYYKGYGIEQDLKKAIEYFGYACANSYTDREMGIFYNNSEAYYQLGEIYFKTTVPSNGFKIAEENYRKAAFKGNIDAQIQLADIYLTLSYTKEEDKAQALQWLENAAKKDNSRALYVLGKRTYYEKKNYQKAIEYLLRASQLNNSDAQYLLGQIYYEGKGVRQDINMAEEFWNKSADNGKIAAQKLLACMYMGKNGYDTYYFNSFQINLKYDRYYFVGNIRFAQDSQKVLYWLSKAISQNDEQAQIILLDVYEKGMGGIKKDLNLAKELAGKICDNGIQKGCDEYRKLNEKGIN